MKRRRFESILIIGFYFIISCNNDSSNSELEVRDYYAKGVADSNHLEKGEWKFYRLDNHSLSQEGQFDHGLRKGKWDYYFPFKGSIFWSSYYSKDSLIRTNIPSFLSVDLEESNFIAFKHIDTSKLLLLKIGISYRNSFNRDKYNKMIIEEVSNNSKKINKADSAVINTTCNRVYAFNKFSGIDNVNREYTLLTINSFVNNCLIEVTVRYGSENHNIGEEVFFSIMSNLFVGNTRFFDENIDCEIIRNKVVKRERRFSLRCNKG